MEKYLYQDLYIQEDTHWWHRSKRATVVDLINTNFKNPKRLKILDIGCGTGKNLETLSKFGQTFGIDNSKEAITFCKKRHLINVYLRKSDNTKFPPNFFDVILMLDVLEHVKEKPTLKEIHRVLKPNGVLILTVPAHQWLWSQWDIVLHHKRRYHRNQLNTVLIENKFIPLKISYMYMFLIPPVIFIRFLKSRFKKSTDYSSDFQINFPIVNNILYQIAKLEKILNNKIAIPIGTSLIAAAAKK